MRYAVVDTQGNVVNAVIWDGESDWHPPEGTTAILDPSDKASPGWTYKDGAFAPPSPPPLPEAYVFNPDFNEGSSMNEILTS